ncbi:MAG TPA: hypothetical protein VK756_08205 [Solirubrobacteraceae bacterium]|jgi:hypothetical protein|nr:hypothetical protein [Solirubrobacteraceae bacterium]
MSESEALLPGPVVDRGLDRGVRRRRVIAAAQTLFAMALALALALAFSVATHKPDLLLVLVLALGAIGVVALAVGSRLEVSVAMLALYLGLLDGPVKLLSASQAASSVRDILIAAVSLGALVRLARRGERLRLPPLSGWVLGFVALVAIEAFNPRTHGLLKIAGGFRQNLEWVPFFFFGYVLMRSKERLRKLFVLLGVIALVNGAVSAYQTHLTPGQLASWGPGYAQLYEDNIVSETGLTARRYLSEGVARVRPPALGTDSGFGGGVGVIALPCTLALFAMWRGRRRWFALLFSLGALVAIATGLGRLQVVGAAIAVVGFLLLSLSAGERVARPLAAVLTLAALALPLGALFVSSESANVFSRYESIEPHNVVQTSTSYKEKSLALIPRYIASAPFGFGLATAGSASTFGGKQTEALEGHGVSSETQYNYVEDELGVAGLILWVALALQVIVLVVRRLPRVADAEVRIDLAAIFAVFVAFALMGLEGSFMSSAAGGPFFWFSVGIAAYWLRVA